MTNDRTGQESPEFEQITPTKIEITPQTTTAEEPQQQEPPKSQRKWVMLSSALAVALVLLVFVLLPRIVSKPEVDIEEAVPSAVSAANKAASQISPFQEAQIARYRKEAQDILADLLDKQFALEEVHVELWGEEQYRLASERAQKGDESYRQQMFQQAILDYRESLAMLSTLLDSVDSVIAEQVKLGYQAIDQWDATAAQQAFDLVLKIDPANSSAAKGLERTGNLNQVLQLLEQAQSLEQGRDQPQDLDRALEILQQAGSLDSESEPVKASLIQVKQKIRERDFAASMSQGYQALEQSRFDQARAAFKRALSLKPKATEARAGLEEVSHRITQIKIASLKKEALALASKEQWQAAQEKYEAVLKLDPSVTFAQQGQKSTSTRARLDSLMQERIDQPERLSTDEVYRETLALLKVARSAGQPGPRLQGQIAQLEALLDQAMTPTPVVLQSDNRTDVTLYKIGHLGNFLSHQVSLKPGTYVLVGKRKGYRDVRREFVVSANEPPDPIKIQCVEKI